MISYNHTSGFIENDNKSNSEFLMYVRSQKYSVLNRVNRSRGAICHPATKFIVHPSRIRMLEGRFEPPRALSNADFAVLTRRIDNVSITDCSNEWSVAGFHGKWANPKHAKLVVDKKNPLLQISKSCIQTCKSFELTVYIIISRLQFGTIFGEYVTARKC